MTPHLDDARAQGYVDRTLGEAERAACADHLDACPDCALLVASYRALAEALDDLAAPAPPAGFTAAVMARVDLTERQRAWDRRLAAGILAVAVGLALAAAALAGGGVAPALAAAAGGFARGAAALALAADVARPILGALRVPIALACGAVALPLLFALSRLVPRPAPASS